MPEETPPVTDKSGRTTPKKTAAQRETEQNPTVEIEFGGDTFTFPDSLENASGDVLDAIEDQQLGKALKWLIGEDQWKTFKKQNPTIGKYGEFFDVYAKKIGLETTGN